MKFVFIVICGLVFLAPTWMCWINYRRAYIGRLVLYSLLLLKLSHYQNVGSLRVNNKYISPLIFFLISFSMWCSALSSFLHANPCLSVIGQPCMEWIQNKNKKVKKKTKKKTKKQQEFELFSRFLKNWKNLFNKTSGLHWDFSAAIFFLFSKSFIILNKTFTESVGKIVEYLCASVHY